jgi:hypothetical protein
VNDHTAPNPESVALTGQEVVAEFFEEFATVWYLVANLTDNNEPVGIGSYEVYTDLTTIREVLGRVLLGAGIAHVPWHTVLSIGQRLHRAENQRIRESVDGLLEGLGLKVLEEGEHDQH